MEIKKLYILLSEGETNIEKDVDMLYKKKIVDKNDITDGDSLLVCISRDYLKIGNLTPAVMIRDQLSNVFCPKWRNCSEQYTSLLPIMNLPGDMIPEVYIMTSNKDIYEDLDYYLHLSNFENRMKMLLTNKGKNLSFVPIESQIRRDDVADLGEMTVSTLELAGYEENLNGPVPGWVFQSANPWLTRVLDLYEISPSISMHPESLTDLRLTRDEFIRTLENPVIMGGPKIGEDIRTSIVESFDVRKDLYNYSKDLLERIQ